MSCEDKTQLLDRCTNCLHDLRYDPFVVDGPVVDQFERCLEVVEKLQYKEASACARDPHVVVYKYPRGCRLAG